MSQMIFARQALLPGGWVRDVRVNLAGGKIISVVEGAALQAGDVQADCLVPGLSNLHSHAFQRGMAGLAERRGANASSFWTWRDVMYRFALGLDPDAMQAVAEMAYAEMLEQGFTRVGEFHYLHHAADGAYANPAEMSARIFAASSATGINLTHLPVFYAHADFGGVAPMAEQRRFIHDLDGFATLMEACKAMLKRDGDRLGIAPHSLRAVTAGELQALVSTFKDCPVHIHVAEQMREVKDCLAATGQRPVEWLLAHHDVDARWCLIHATHVTGDERSGIARSGAVAGLCPITEANLGDGVFPAAAFMGEGGSFGVGSDSNVEITAAGELRMLEYGQRLMHQARNVLAKGGGSTGSALFHAALRGGAQALAAPVPEIAAGAPADLVALKDRQGWSPSGDQALDRWIFSGAFSVDVVWADGRQVVAEGRHHQRDAIATRFSRAVQPLLMV